ncbi:cytochrome c biogenesis CcdA family protein [Serinicoccus kebangsaanensis]|uniref:cytochrome c biogenesis CcdA family protein n=1 Tax=Serinicoccus kebangsaanensis TaxID=2602069 RepID=UPI00124D9F0F|nr:cytochrome c biogenesis protein CcdA [Serinicoccus kebangsaanensis]
MLALLGALVAGVLTTLAPCVLPLLPVIVGGSLASDASPAAQRRRAVVVAGSLSLSVAAFTLLLKGTTALIGVPPGVWRWLSGGILLALGAAMLLPAAWERASAALRLASRSQAGLRSARRREGVVGQVLTGAALGPVFSSCSPLYAYVVVTVLPAEPGYGLALLTAYCLGLGGTLLAVAIAGQSLVRRLGWAADPRGWLQRSLGLVFVLVGLVVGLGWDRDLQAWILEHSPVAPWELDSGFIPEL